MVGGRREEVMVNGAYSGATLHLVLTEDQEVALCGGRVQGL